MTWKSFLRMILSLVSSTLWTTTTRMILMRTMTPMTYLAFRTTDQYGCGKSHKKLNCHLFDKHLWMTYSRLQQGSSHPKQKVQREQLNTQFLQSLKWNTAIDAIRSVDPRNMENILLQHTDPYDGTFKEMHPFALATKSNAANNPTWEQAMNGPDSA